MMIKQQFLLTKVHAGYRLASVDCLSSVYCVKIIRQTVSWCDESSPEVGRKWKWSDGVKKGEIDLFWCISITNNVESYNKFNEKAQTANFSVFTMGGHWLTGALCSKRGKQGKLKRELLKILNWYDLSRVGPCERARPEDSKNVVVFEIWRF